MNLRISSVPTHVGLIPDGGRRWARQKSCSYLESYSVTMQLITRFIVYLFERNVSAISIYLLSKENLNRPQTDLEPVFISETELLNKLLPTVIDKFEVKTFVADNCDLLPIYYTEALRQLLEHSRNNQSRRLYLLVGYNPFDELEFVLSDKKKPITLECLWVPEKVDLLIRSSGECRISNFLPLQSAYAELIFLQKHWNDLSEQDIEESLRKYQIRSRRFGH